MFHRHFTKFLQSLAILVSLGCSYQANANDQEEQAMDEQIVADSISLGRFYSGRSSYVSFRYHVDQPRDVLVDLLDKTGYYTGTRKTLKPEYSSEYFSLQIPKQLRDPESAYISIKLIPVGGEWWQKLSEVKVPVILIRALPIDKKLFYNYPLSYFLSSFSRNISNHDGVSVFIQKNAESFEMGYEYSGYGSGEKLNLNLLTGDLQQTKDNYGHDKTTRIFHAQASGQEATDYVQSLRDMKRNFEYVETGRGADYSADYQQLRESNEYLRSVLLQIDPVAQDKLEFKGLHSTAEGPYSPVIRVGKKLSFLVKYASAESRHLLLALLVDGKTIASSEVSLPAGEDSIAVPFDIPQNAPRHSKAKIELKLVANGNSAGQVIAESQGDSYIYPVNSLDNVYAAEQASSLDQLYISVNYAIDVPMDLRVELFDPNNKRIDSHQYPLPLSETGYFYEAKFSSDLILDNGQLYKLAFKLIPSGGGAESKPVDQAEKFFRKTE